MSENQNKQNKNNNKNNNKQNNNKNERNNNIMIVNNLTSFLKKANLCEVSFFQYIFFKNLPV